MTQKKQTKSEKQTQNQTLYRKYRPKSFDNVYGQKEVVDVLKNSIKNNAISHAYLFSGTRGCGKTSIARIFANELGISKDDVYEIDGASNRKIEDIREIRNNVSVLPISSEYKMYIIDEAHMLTKEASNALLKTLEEPPEHVIFVLATTEKEKFLDTIISRCQVFDFNRADLESITNLISDIAKKEKVKLDENSLKYIAKQAHGSFRDAVSLFQKIISVLGQDIDFEKIKKEFESNSENLVDDFLTALNAKNKEQLLQVYLSLKEKDFDLKIFTQNVLEKVRHLLLISNSKDFENYYQNLYSKDEMDFLKSLENINSLDLKKILETLDNVEKSSNPNIAFEISILNLV
ncbi:DNA polymerase III, subunit gamma and tau [Candidatus Campbellbacteria bacterium]|nr:MAG: DNA polymerase III, subunit gamma and tau [Candidatus Campbellbacteria bacterium]